MVKLMTFSSFTDYFLNKIITEIEKLSLNMFFPFARGGNVHGNWMGGAWLDCPPWCRPFDK